MHERIAGTSEECTATMEFHISRAARDRYRLDETLFSLSGNVIFANLHATRLFAQRMNSRRDVINFPERAVKAGQINAMGLIDEILHLVAGLYRQQRNPDVARQALDWLHEDLGRDEVDLALSRFVDQFPPVAVYRREVAKESYLDGETSNVPHRHITLEELLMLWLSNVNPAFSPFLELFDDTDLERETAYSQIAASLHDFFGTQPMFGPRGQNLIDMLRSPAIAVPHSLTGQLEYIRTQWGSLLGKHLYRLLSGLDLIREEEKVSFQGPGPARIIDFAGQAGEPERFSPDRDWMPSLVLMAKNSYVWLDQLSKKYQQPITRLDQIPDSELDALAGWGFSGLWLIGLWERSPASKQIKQIMGNPDAVASAYSLHDYQIAADLGGESAYGNLRDRSWARGIRLASDMVPNHVGIASRWVFEHPDWFVSLDYSPFPSYSFNGPNLSHDDRAGIYLEDHYYDHSDAAVVFKRVDHRTGTEKFIYHGNDGTSMPWNDTAQLNYLNPEVREAVIQTILHVARQFPIIRFDAAMTLAKKHFQRLWFPEPGGGGAIPTRAEHGLTKADFDAAMPAEFWREVVDRVAAEAPDTLLLAEAFWLLEGYFVRTLGMHRVYNSAFMHMLRDEDNAKYRSVIKNTLEFEPEVLKRYVNFMNNPDEETAIAQFGDGDKYFGVCALLATLPGLPMFGHGQVEGFAEKYGMEYRRAYWDEWANDHLVQRHEREIFPLLHRRYLFADVEHFLLYDLFTPEGTVNEDVYAYSNRSGEQRALVVYHNRFATARGWLRDSAAYSVKDGQSGTRRLERKSIGEGLGLTCDSNTFCLFRDQLTGLEYIRSSKQICESGLYVDLDAYKCHVFLDFREVQDDARQQYARLATYLDGLGVPSIDEALREVFLQPVHIPFMELANESMFRRLMDAGTALEQGDLQEMPAGAGGALGHAPLLDEIEHKSARLMQEIKQLTAGQGNPEAIARTMRRRLGAILELSDCYDRFLSPHLPGGSPAALAHICPGDDHTAWGILLGWLFTHALGEVLGEEHAAQRSRSWLDEWLLGRIVTKALQDFGLDAGASSWAISLIKPLITHQRWFADPISGDHHPHRILRSWLGDEDVQQVLQVNRYRDTLWFNKEAFEQLLRWMLAVAAVDISAAPGSSDGKAAQEILRCLLVIQRLQQAGEDSEYQVTKLLEAARG